MDLLNKISAEPTSGQILQVFYKEHDLPADGGFSEPRAKVKLTDRIHLYIPNIDARRIVLLQHDVHHLLTGYTTILKDELEISSWEVGSGCGKYWFGWAINMQGLMLGLLIRFGGVFRAFVRGRHSMNLYHNPIEKAKLKNMTIKEIESIIKIPPKNELIKPTPKDIISFLWYVFIGGIYSIALVLIYTPLLFIYNAVVFIKIKTISAGSKSL